MLRIRINGFSPLARLCGCGCVYICSRWQTEAMLSGTMAELVRCLLEFLCLGNIYGFIVAVHTHVDFIVLPNCETRLSAPWADFPLLYALYIMCLHSQPPTLNPSTQTAVGVHLLSALQPCCHTSPTSVSCCSHYCHPNCTESPHPCHLSVNIRTPVMRIA